MEQITQEKPVRPFNSRILILIGVVLVGIFVEIFLAYYFQKITNTVSPTKNLAPVSSWVFPKNTFTYNGNLATADLTSYIKSTLKSDFIPAKIDVIHQLSTFGTADDTVYTYGARWKQNNDTIFSAYHFNESSNDQRDIEMIITHPTVDSITPQDMLKKYFNNPNLANFTCTQVQNSQNKMLKVCESFYGDTKGIKHGVGVIIGTIGTTANAPLTLLVACEIPPKSTNKDWKSCLQQFAQQGVK